MMKIASKSTSGSGTYTILNTEQSEKSEDEKEVNTDNSECFRVSSSTKSCFSVSAGVGDCFYIKDYNSDDDDDKPLPQQIDLEKSGVIKIIAIHASGVSDLYVLADFQFNEEPEKRAVALFNFTPLGAGDVNGGMWKVDTEYQWITYIDESIPYSDITAFDNIFSTNTLVVYAPKQSGQGWSQWLSLSPATGAIINDHNTEGDILEFDDISNAIIWVDKDTLYYGITRLESGDTQNNNINLTTGIISKQTINIGGKRAYDGNRKLGGLQDASYREVYYFINTTVVPSPSGLYLDGERTDIHFYSVLGKTTVSNKWYGQGSSTGWICNKIEDIDNNIVKTISVDKHIITLNGSIAMGLSQDSETSIYQYDLDKLYNDEY